MFLFTSDMGGLYDRHKSILFAAPTLLSGATTHGGASAQEGRLVTRASADDQPDLSRTSSVPGDDRTRAPFKGMEMSAMSGKHAYEHLLDRTCTVLDKLFGLLFVLPRNV